MYGALGSTQIVENNEVESCFPITAERTIAYLVVTQNPLT